MIVHGIHGGTCPMCCWDVDTSAAGAVGGELATTCQLCSARIAYDAAVREQPSLGAPQHRYGAGLLWAGSLTYILLAAATH